MNGSEPDLKLPKDSIRLMIQGVGHIPSFKNTKSLFKNRKTGKMFIATDPRKKKIMDQIIQSIASQLIQWYQITEKETPTGLSLQSWIASSVPLKDSRQWIKENGAERVLIVNKGEEGAMISIEKL